MAIPTRYIQTKPLQQSVLSHPLSPAIIDEPVSITAGKTGDAPAPVSALLLSVACKQVPHRLLHPCPHGNSQPHVAAQRVASACTLKGKRNLKSSSCPFTFLKASPGAALCQALLCAAASLRTEQLGQWGKRQELSSPSAVRKQQGLYLASHDHMLAKYVQLHQLSPGKFVLGTSISLQVLNSWYA